MTDKLHPSHETRISDASSFDEICIHCGATDRLGSWGALANPCPSKPEAQAGPAMTGREAITPEQLAEWKRLADAATEGPWASVEISPEDKEWGACEITAGDGYVSTMICGVDNAAFIAASRNAVPALIAEVERLTAEREDLKATNRNLSRTSIALHAPLCL